MSTAQTLILSQCVKRAKDTMARISVDHRDLHGNVSKVGKAIDRVSVQTFEALSTCAILIFQT